MTRYVFDGRVIAAGTRAGLAGARIEAWDAEGLCSDLVACAFADAEGRFSLRLDAAAIEELFGERTPAVFAATGALLVRRAQRTWQLSIFPASGRIEITDGARPAPRRSRRPRLSGLAPS